MLAALISIGIFDGASPNGRNPLSRIESAKWTGLRTDLDLSEERTDRLRQVLAIAEEHAITMAATQQEATQARAYILAIRALADAPDPPAEIIWDLIEKFDRLSGFASLFISIVSLFVR